ncbi:YraN family protein [Leucobacter aridicollis]|uniref:YraN family protein n=1 Tax=Leucobacter aridicollis TaxID=283878 RepID=UPI002105C0FA|nr:YraN family protein [Leucobacter aridicollis]UTX52057.1 YraN family protein [Leucobacter aridicollis]
MARQHSPKPLPDPSDSEHDRATTIATTTRRDLGARGELIAADYLVSRGFTLIARNWRCRYGELDLVMSDGDVFVAVEVKTRSGTGYGAPLESITARKAARLRRLLLEWGLATGNRGARLRVDAVGITLRPGDAAPQIEHLRAVA